MPSEDDNEQLLFPDPTGEKAVSTQVGDKARRYSKYVVYVDESGDHSLETVNPHYPIFVLAFCVFHKTHYSEVVVPALEKFKFHHFGHDQVVLHEHEIRKEKGAFKIFPTRGHKKQFMGELGAIIESSQFILMSCVIHKDRLKQEHGVDNPYHIALRHCLESLNGFLEEKGEQDKLTHIVFEQRGKKEDRELELEFRRFCDGQNMRGAVLPYEILFSDKKAMSSGLQLADLVARPTGLGVLRPEQPNQAFETLKKKFYCAGGRDATGQDYEQWGLKIHPSKKAKSPDDSHQSYDAD